MSNENSNNEVTKQDKEEKQAVIKDGGITYVNGKIVHINYGLIKTNEIKPYDNLNIMMNGNVDINQNQDNTNKNTNITEGLDK